MQYACNLPEAVQCSLKSDQDTFNARGDIRAMLLYGSWGLRDSNLVHDQQLVLL